MNISKYDQVENWVNKQLSSHTKSLNKDHCLDGEKFMQQRIKEMMKSKKKRKGKQVVMMNTVKVKETWKQIGGLKVR